jgi:8-oxo-dGTP pyrophosphatase MutT (NUDIX family)
VILLIIDINRIFKNRTAGIMGEYKKSAVMILIYEENEKEYIVFEVRSKKLKSQPGDICLPGGRIEENETAREAAIRETIEELNIEEGDLEYIGEMDYFISPYGSIMYPFIAKLKKMPIEPSRDEVDHIFTVPLEFFLNNGPLLYELEIGPNLKDDFPYHFIKGGRDYKFSRGKLKQYFYEYNEYAIWGFTAMIIKNFIDILIKEF